MAPSCSCATCRGCSVASRLVSKHELLFDEVSDTYVHRFTFTDDSVIIIPCTRGRRALATLEVALEKAGAAYSCGYAATRCANSEDAKPWDAGQLQKHSRQTVFEAVVRR
ncbi:unnamed protein product, partial [Amoebophrya sp. A25]|eukprot:GSA25T00015975001.1